jgi:hypothetical protein
LQVSGSGRLARPFSFLEVKKFPFKNKELGAGEKIVGKPHVRFRARIAFLIVLT